MLITPLAAADWEGKKSEGFFGELAAAAIKIRNDNFQNEVIVGCCVAVTASRHGITIRDST